MDDRFRRDFEAFRVGMANAEWWVTAWIICPICSHEHVSIHPSTCTELECPYCGYMIPWTDDDA